MIASSELRLLTSKVDLFDVHRSHSERFPFLLQSTATGSAQARYDLLLYADDAHLALEADGQLAGVCSEGAGGFLEALDRWWQREKEPAVKAAELPFLGGWFLYLGYELAGEIEPRLSLPSDVLGQPTALAVRCPAAVIHDHALAETWVVAEPGRRALVEQLAELCEHLTPPPESASPIDVDTIEEEPERYRDFVRRIREYVFAGDVFQANVSRQWRGVTDSPATDIYEQLRRSNPAPFSGLMNWRGWSVVSSSPERLVCRRGDILETRPIAGTRRRGDGDVEDGRLSGELLSHPKERAEHIMLIDLERNDLGRVCVPGTVQVNEMMVLESYAHVHHIVSNIRGRAREGLTPGEVIAALFPGGTITGCPKVRCMEIIAELEGKARGPYTGAFGYLDRSGDMDLNILIRTLSLADGHVDLRAGGGIVADSVPENELAETRHKAKGLLSALSSVRP